MNGKMPVLMIYCSEANGKCLKEVMAGIEEEGVLYQARTQEDAIDAITLAYQAAKASALGVGIGIQGNNVQLAVREQVAPTIIDMAMSPRTAGQNGARYIKKKPLR